MIKSHNNIFTILKAVILAVGLVTGFLSSVLAATGDGSYKNCPAPTPEMIEQVKNLQISTEDFMDSDYATILAMRPQYIDFVGQHIRPLIYSLTGMSQPPLSSESIPNNIIYIVYNENTYDFPLSNRMNFFFMKNIVGVDEFNDAFLEKARVLSEKIHDPKKLEPYYIKIKQTGYFNRVGFATKITSYTLGDISLLEGTYKQGHAILLEDMFKALATREKFLFSHPSILNNQPNLYDEAKAYMAKTDCYTPYDTAFLWHHFQQHKK